MGKYLPLRFWRRGLGSPSSVPAALSGRCWRSASQPRRPDACRGGDSIQIAPPLTITKAEVDDVIQRLDDSFVELEKDLHL